MWRITWIQSFLFVLSVPLNCDGAVPPIFTDSFKAISVNESASLGTVIGSITVTDADGDTFTLTRNDDNTRQYVNLTITEDIGKRIRADVILIKELDYENKPLINLQFQATDAYYTSIGTIQILVQDVNDNPPLFVNQPYLAQIPENAANGSTVFNTTVFDMDKTVLGGIVSVALLTHRELFHVTNEGMVTLIGVLDYEQVPFYNIGLKAEDNGRPKLSSTAKLFVTVTDVQDTPPYFTNLPYITEIWENHTVGSTVFSVSAFDGDRGNPENIIFSLYYSTCPGFFSIGTDGRITLLKTADRDNGTVSDNNGICVLTVKAREINGSTVQTGPLFEASRAVTITVKDLNDNSPTFRSTYLSATIRENMPAGVPVTFNTPLQVSDKDQGDNAKSTLTLSTYAEYFELTPSEVQGSSVLQVKVTNNSILDYEAYQTLQLKIVASAGTSRSTATVTLHIENENDNSPEFSETSYYGSVQEGSSVGTSVLTVTVVDHDLPPFNSVIYQLLGADGMFSIDSTGKVTTSSSQTDRETRSMYYLLVVACDQGGRKEIAQLAVNITDANDNPPLFSREYDGFLEENKQSFKKPISVQATDADVGINAVVKYSTVRTYPAGLESHFRVNSTSGRVSVRNSLDYESLSGGQLVLGIRATDSGHPSLHSDVNVTLMLISLQCKTRDTCLNNGPCQNGGTCTVRKDNTSTCHCPPGFTGAVCGKTDTGCLLRAPILHCEKEVSSGCLFRWCKLCEKGFYKLGLACEVCPRPHAGCKHVTCTSANQDLRCTTCYPGFYLDGNSCTECSPIPSDCAEYTCTGSEDVACTRCRKDSVLVDGRCFPCPSLSVIPDCEYGGRDGCFKHWCSKCAPGFFIRGDACDVCPTDDPGCLKSVCNSTSDSQCAQCFHDYELIGGNCYHITSPTATPSSSCSDSPSADCPSLENSHGICSDLSSACHLCPRYCDVCQLCNTPLIG